MGALIICEDVWKVYRLGDVEVQALRGVSLQIERGEFVAVMGSSGSGKSTLMNLLGCLDRPTKGTYWLDGRDVGRASQDELAELRSREIGFVFQNFNLVPRTSALENAQLPLLLGTAAPRAACAGCGGARARGAERSRPALSFPTIRRAAATRGHRARAGVLPFDPPGRRADRQSGYRIQPGDHGGADSFEPGGRPHRPRGDSRGPDRDLRSTRDTRQGRADRE